MQVSKEQYFLALLVMSLLLVDIIILAFVPIPERNENTFNLFLGAQLGVVSTVAAFMFPSNVSSANKDRTIQQLAAKTYPVETRTTRTETLETQAVTHEEDEGNARPV